MIKKFLAVLTATMMCACVMGCRQQGTMDSTIETTTVTDSVEGTAESETKADQTMTATKATDAEIETTKKQETSTTPSEYTTGETIPFNADEAEDLDHVEPEPTTEEVTQTNAEPQYHDDGNELL